jgi:hypothetical protein
MLGKVQKITEPPRDPLRVALAECILDRDAKAKATELAREAVAKANALVSDAEHHAEAVKIALASARDGREARLREAVEGGGVIEKPTSTREQRFAELDALDELAAAKSVLANCVTSLGFAADAEQWSERKVEACITPILTAEVERLLGETTRLSDELHRKHEILIWLRSLLPPGDDQRKRIGFLLPPPAAPGVKETDFRAPENWVAAREALMRDAEAALPM